MLACLLEDMLKLTHTNVNSDRVRKISRDPDKTWPSFSCLMVAARNCTNLDVASPARTPVHELDVKIQSVPDVRRKIPTARKWARPHPHKEASKYGL